MTNAIDLALDDVIEAEFKSRGRGRGSGKGTPKGRGKMASTQEEARKAPNWRVWGGKGTARGGGKGGGRSKSEKLDMSLEDVIETDTGRKGRGKGDDAEEKGMWRNDKGGGKGKSSKGNSDSWGGKGGGGGKGWGQRESYPRESNVRDSYSRDGYANEGYARNGYARESYEDKKGYSGKGFKSKGSYGGRDSGDSFLGQSWNDKGGKSGGGKGGWGNSGKSDGPQPPPWHEHDDRGDSDEDAWEPAPRRGYADDYVRQPAPRVAPPAVRMPMAGGAQRSSWRREDGLPQPRATRWRAEDDEDYDEVPPPVARRSTWRREDDPPPVRPTVRRAPVEREEPPPRRPAVREAVVPVRELGLRAERAPARAVRRAEPAVAAPRARAQRPAYDDEDDEPPPPRATVTKRARVEEEPERRGPMKRVKVTNIPRDLDPRDIKEAFEEETGKIVECDVDRGTAFMTFKTPEAAKKAVETFDRGELNGQTIEVVLTR